MFLLSSSQRPGPPSLLLWKRGPGQEKNKKILQNKMNKPINIKKNVLVLRKPFLTNPYRPYLLRRPFQPKTTEPAAQRAKTVPKRKAKARPKAKANAGEDTPATGGKPKRPRKG